MPLVKISRHLTRYELLKTQAATLMGLSDVQEWSYDGVYLIVEHSETSDAPPVPPLTGVRRNFTLVQLASIYDALGIPIGFRDKIQIELTGTHIIFHVSLEES